MIFRKDEWTLRKMHGRYDSANVSPHVRLTSSLLSYARSQSSPIGEAPGAGIYDN